MLAMQSFRLQIFRSAQACLRFLQMICEGGSPETVSKLKTYFHLFFSRSEGPSENSPGREPGVERKQMFSPEGAAQFIL